nr:SDR family NAD(P)-dependent oxidoreductase [uncultured Faecalibacillus sp.]
MKEIIIVTGASSGMGKEFARQIEKKYQVDELWVIARRKERLESLKEILETKVKVLALDLTQKESFEILQEALFKEKPRVKVLVNCSGYGKLDHYENMSLETIENMMNLNMLAVVKMVNTVLPYMHKESHIVNFASCSGYMPIPYLNIYAASKAFVLNYSRALNEELKYRGIHVLAICPYWVETEFFDRAVEKNKKPVVIRYGKVYQAKDVIKKAIKDMESSKDVSLYGTINKIQILGMKVLPHRLVKKIWMAYQNLDGTRKIR